MHNTRRLAYQLVLFLAAASIVEAFAKPPVYPPFTGIQSSQIPSAVGEGISLGDHAVDPHTREVLNSADIVSRNYQVDGQNIDFLLIGGQDRYALHDPRSCLVGAGWQLVDDRSEQLSETGIDIHSCHAMGTEGLPNCDIVYLYLIDGRPYDRITLIRARMLVSALVGYKHTPVYFMRFIEVLSSDPAIAAKRHKELVDFAAAMYRDLKPEIETKVAPQRTS